MIYLDHGATSFPKPRSVIRAVQHAMQFCANPGRGGHAAAMEAARIVYRCRERAAAMFDCQPEQVVFTANCTHGLNLAVEALVKPGNRVVVSGFEHNAVMRPLYGKNARIAVTGRRLFCWEDTLEEFEKALRKGADAAIFTHVSNVFGYILPVAEMATLCRQYGVPFCVDAAQSAGVLPVTLQQWGADFVAMPGHKGLLGPQGTGMLLCSGQTVPILKGGTGGDSVNRNMPEELPERLEAGTLNVAGIAGLEAGMTLLENIGISRISEKEEKLCAACTEELKKMGLQVFCGPHQAGTVSFVPPTDCEDFATGLSDRGIAVRAGLHCAPLAHESAGTLNTGTVRVSFGQDTTPGQIQRLLQAINAVLQV